MGGTAKQQEMVKAIAPEWTQHANLEFAFTDDPTAEIRVSFDSNDGAWSYVGTDNQNIPLHAATLNLGWQDDGVILHEFGHMIGLSHEHSNPDGGIQWNEQVVIQELAGPPKVNLSYYYLVTGRALCLDRSYHPQMRSNVHGI